MSFLEMLDVVNERLILDGKEPIAFDHDCREGICGQCGVVINGDAHGPRRATTTCQLHMGQLSQRRRSDHRALACGGLSGRQGLDGRSHAPLIGSSPAEGLSRCGPGTPPRPTISPCPKTMPSCPWTPPPASPCLRCRLPECLRDALRLGQGRTPQLAAPGRTGKIPPRHRDDRPDGRGRIWQLHQSRRV